MMYCTNCIIPDTRPGIKIEADGVCNACRDAERVRQTVNWKKRAQAWRNVVRQVKRKKARYDCLIPVSGGKDSTWQTMTCLEAGLHPLAVTWRPPVRTKVGQQNLDNLISLGVDHIDFSVNPRIEKKFMLETFTKAGSPAIPMHLALFNIPLTIAVTWDIPLIVWGENSAIEYGGSDEKLKGARLTLPWLEQYGVSQGTTADDWLSPDLPAEALAPYKGPGEQELAAAGIQAVFLGHYFSWDPQTSRQVAEEHGFRSRGGGPKTGYYNYADIDDEFISIHHFLKWYKFGFTRLFDNLSLEIRRSRMTRAQALEIVRRRGDQTPRADIKVFCNYVGITEGEFFAIAERWRSHTIWVKEKGVWKITNFLIPDWQWT